MRGKHFTKLPDELLHRVREMRRKATDAESLLWSLLRDRQAGCKFRRQHPHGRYILDFYCHEVGLAIELDGSGHNEQAQRMSDAERTHELEQDGIRVIRFWNEQVLRETEAVLQEILDALTPVPDVPAPEALTAALSLGERVNTMKTRASVHFRHFWGRAKREELLASLQNPNVNPYQSLAPAVSLGLPFAPMQTSEQYATWPLLPDLFPVSFPGIKTSRDDVVVDIDRGRLESRMHAYFDQNISHDEIRRIAPGAMDSVARFDPISTRDTLRRRGFLPENIGVFGNSRGKTNVLIWALRPNAQSTRRPE